MLNKIKLIISILFLLGFSSCKLKEKMVYFNENKSTEIQKDLNFEFKYQTDDIVFINVSCTDQELAKPFNNNFYRISAQDGYQNGLGQEGYLIDKKGEIDFPVLGKVKIGGLNRIEAIEFLSTILKQYINDPIVNIRVLNFRVTVLGSVVKPGVYTIPNEKMTILDVISLAGDLKITGERNNVKLYRELNNTIKEYTIDLTKKEVFKNESFYLKQNDVIYIQPNLQERYSSTVFKNTFITAISAFTVILTALNIVLSK